MWTTLEGSMQPKLGWYGCSEETRPQQETGPRGTCIKRLKGVQESLGPWTL